MKAWYSIKREAAPFGTDPFGEGELSDKVRVDPYGNMGGDSLTGVVEPSYGKHHPNDYFGEDPNTLLEKKLNKKNKNRKKIKIKKKKTNSSSKNKIVEAQWGLKGPKLPTWNQDNWVYKTYRDIKNLNKLKQRPPQSKRPQKKIRRPLGLEVQDLAEDKNNDTKEKFKKALERSISIRSYLEDSYELGSGFFINTNMVLTCYHVAFPDGFTAKEINVKYEGKEYSAKAIAGDSYRDCAILIVNDPSFQNQNYFKLDKKPFAEPGEPVIIVGTPLGFENIVGTGIIASTEDVIVGDEDDKIPLMFMTANINPGNSGGPVISEDKGTILGMSAAVVKDEISDDPSFSSGINAAISIKTIKEFLKNNKIRFEEL